MTRPFTAAQINLLLGYRQENAPLINARRLYYARDSRILRGLHSRGIVRNISSHKQYRWRFNFTPFGAAFARALLQLPSTSPIITALRGDR